MASVFASGNHAIVASRATAVDMIMVDLRHRLPGAVAMASFADVAAIDVTTVLAGGNHAVVANSASTINVIVIDLRDRFPGAVAVARFANIT